MCILWLVVKKLKQFIVLSQIEKFYWALKKGTVLSSNRSWPLEVRSGCYQEVNLISFSFQRLTAFSASKEVPNGDCTGKYNLAWIFEMNWWILVYYIVFEIRGIR